MQRGYYVESKDVRQIAASIGMTPFDRRVPDHASVDALMQHLQAMEDSPLLFYRPETADQKLIIVLQTPSMRKAMLDYGRFVLCVDTTHGTTRYHGK